MAKSLYQQLSADERRQALLKVREHYLYKPFWLEKDVWIVASLQSLHSAEFTEFADGLTFKGGTSLSKGFGDLRRFSEDVDVTYDLRSLAPDLVASAGGSALPPTRSQERRWRKVLRERITEWVADRALPLMRKSLAEAGFEAKLHADGQSLFICYQPIFAPAGIALPEVRIEFGARSTGEPRQRTTIVCEVANHLPEVIFPQAQLWIMLAERTFWEKAAAAHVFCKSQRLRGERRSRHWHDLVQLDKMGIADQAIARPDIAREVVHHQTIFFAEKDFHGDPIDYEAAFSGYLQLVPNAEARTMLAADHARMLESGMLVGENESFDELMEHCARLQERINAAQGGTKT